MTGLYELFDQMIRDRGGRERLAEDIESEWLKYYHKERFSRKNNVRVFFRYSKIEDKYLIDNYGDLSMTKITSHLKRTSDSVYSRVFVLRARGHQFKNKQFMNK